MDDEHDIVRRAKKLEPDALASIFDHYYVPLYRYIALHTGDSDDAEDLTSDVFRRMLRAFHQGQGAERHLRGWLYSIARNLLADNARRQQHRQHDALNAHAPSNQPSVEASAEQAWWDKEVATALLRLPDIQRDVIILRYVQGFAFSEIADVLKLTTGAVKAHQARALERLRRELGAVQSKGGSDE